MKKLLVLGAIATFSASAFAEKDCTVKLNVRSYLDKVSTQEIVDIANELVSSTNIEITLDSGSDYMLELYTNESLDHHDARFAYVNGHLSVWPSNQIQSRSAVENSFHSKVIRKRRLTKERVTNLLTKSLSNQLKSCEGIDQTIKSTGNGTLIPIDGDVYTTKAGATFTRVGNFWKDPSGLMWGDILGGEYDNATVDSSAVKACDELGARLPTTQEYHNLLSYFSPSGARYPTLSQTGKYEFNALFPWSFGMYTTATRDPQGVGHDFHHVSGTSSPAMAHWKLNVRCVK